MFSLVRDFNILSIHIAVGLHRQSTIGSDTAKVSFPLGFMGILFGESALPPMMMEIYCQTIRLVRSLATTVEIIRNSRISSLDVGCDRTAPPVIYWSRFCMGCFEVIYTLKIAHLCVG